MYYMVEQSISGRNKLISDIQYGFTKLFIEIGSLNMYDTDFKQKV